MLTEQRRPDASPGREAPFGGRTRRKSIPVSQVASQVPATGVEAKRLKANGALAHVSTANLARIAKATVPHQLRAGQIIWNVGDKAKHVIVVESGLIRLRRTRFGEVSSYGLFGPGDIIGLFACMGEGAYPTDATAVTRRVEVLRIPASALMRSIGDDRATRLFVSRALVQFTSVLSAKIDIMSAGPVHKRLAALFLYLVDRFGETSSESLALLPLPLARDHLGELIGARTETVVRTLKSWSRDGWVLPTPEGFEVQRLDMLQQLLRS